MGFAIYSITTILGAMFTIAMGSYQDIAYKLAYILFDKVTSYYTYLRLLVEPYNIFKPVLKISKITLHFDSSSDIGDNKKITVNSLDELKQYECKKPFAVSIQYSFSDWNEKFIKLLKTDNICFKDWSPQYNSLNYDFTVTSENREKVAEKDMVLLANIEAYIRRATTYDAEQTLKLLSENPHLIEFMYGDYENNFRKGHFSFRVYDELGTEYCLMSKN